jgi:hypothetical protein
MSQLSKVQRLFKSLKRQVLLKLHKWHHQLKVSKIKVKPKVDTCAPPSPNSKNRTFQYKRGTSRRAVPSKVLSTSTMQVNQA